MGKKTYQGLIQDFFLGGGALVSYSTSTPINHIVFFFRRIPVVLDNRRSSQGGGRVRTPCTLPLDSPLPIVSVTCENERISIKNSLPYLKCVLRLSYVVHGPIYGRFMGFYVNGFLSI